MDVLVKYILINGHQDVVFHSFHVYFLILSEFNMVLCGFTTFSVWLQQSIVNNNKKSLLIVGQGNHVVFKNSVALTTYFIV